MGVDAHGMPVRIIVTKSTRNYCTQSHALITGIKADNLISHKAYDSNDIIESAEESGIRPVIPTRGNRKVQRD